MSIFKKEKYILLAKRRSQEEFRYTKPEGISLDDFITSMDCAVFTNYPPTAWEWCYIMNLKNNKIVFDFLKK